MAVYTEIDEQQARDICRRWDLGELRAVQGIAKGSVNTNYRLETDRTSWFLRIDERRTAPEVDFEVALLEHLSANGFPSPAPRRSTEGAATGTIEGKVFLVFPFLTGADKPAEEFSLEDLEAAGAMLGRLHEAAAGFEGAQPNRFGSTAIARMWAESREAAHAIVPEAAALVDEELQDMPALLEDHPLPAEIIHGDLFPDNILFTGPGEISWILDFEAACADAHPYDLGTAINALAWPDGHKSLDPERTEALLRGYTQVREPTSQERFALPTYLRLTALRFLVTRIRDFALTPAPPGGRVDKDYMDYVRRLRFWRETG